MTQSQLSLIELAHNFQSRCTECGGEGFFGTLAAETYKLCGTCDGAGSTTKIKYYKTSVDTKYVTFKFVKDLNEDVEMNLMQHIPFEDWEALLHHTKLEDVKGGRIN